MLTFLRVYVYVIYYIAPFFNSEDIFVTILVFLKINTPIFYK